MVTLAQTELVFSPEVEAALKENRPVVALESTVITHGLPQPQNIAVARQIEAAVRQHGAVPATIAIIKGRVKVGLTDAELDYLAEVKNARKCSVRDLPLVLVEQGDGATTVAATMVIAHRAGIPVFATGGIGGVHRGGRLDISTDLMELGRTPITVVCAGLKAFLDLPASLEVLETNAVPVLGYQTDEFPAFYSRQSGLPVDLRVDTPAAAAAVIRARDALRLANAILLAAPLSPAEEWPAEQANAMIDQAIALAENENIKGKEITPFVLSKMTELSGGRSIEVNTALLENNAQIAAQVAAALKA